ncbi:MAG: helix-turn-helix transcriptional regulator [Sedimenticola sp.]
MISLVQIKDAEAEIGTRLRETRKATGLTQAQLAVRAGTNQPVIQKIESGHSQRPRMLADLSHVLKVNPAWLQWGDLFASVELPNVQQRPE